MLDFFDLLTGDETDSKQLAWKLVSASTNSPFTAEGEAVSLVPDVDVAVIERAQKVRLSRGFASMKRGEQPSGFAQANRAEKPKNVLNRNLNGVGSTEVTLYDDIESVVITPNDAQIAISTFSRREVLPTPPSLLLKRQREERGTIEGIFVDVGLHYNAPAIRVIERRTKTAVWCRVDEATRDEIAAQASFSDVWERRRIKVRGRIRYDSREQIISVHALSIERLSPRVITTADVHDADFTEGVRTSEYLELLREGDLAE